MLLILLPFFFVKAGFTQATPFEVGDTFTVDTIYNVNKEPVLVLDSLSAKVVVLNFWMIGCRGCVEEMPYLNDLYAKYEAEKVAFFSITLNSDRQLAPFLEKHPIAWPILEYVDFPGLMGYEVFNINCMPTTIIIDTNQVIQYARCAPLVSDRYAYTFLTTLNGLLE